MAKESVKILRGKLDVDNLLSQLKRRISGRMASILSILGRSLGR